MHFGYADGAENKSVDSSQKPPLEYTSYRFIFHLLPAAFLPMQSRCDFRLHQSYSVHLEIVWTLPHPAKVIFFHVAEIRPILQITALINQQSAFVVNGASQNQIPCIFSTPYLWVTGVGFTANLFFCNRWNDRLFSFDIIEGHAIIRRNHHLCSEKLVVSTLVNIFWIFLQIIDTRVI
mgnify:CR=1 FL=1